MKEGRRDGNKGRKKEVKKEKKNKGEEKDGIVNGKEEQRRKGKSEEKC